MTIREMRGTPPGPRGRAQEVAIGAVAGAVALTVGVGVGLRWLVAGELAWQTVLGVLGLVAGVFLMGLALRPAGTLARALVLAFVVVTVWTMAPALVATVVPPTVHGMGAPLGVGLDAREITFETEDGVRLWGWYVASRNGAAVVLRHGSGSTATDLLSHAAVLAESGYGILMTDARGHGLSEGVAMDFGWFGDLDTRAAVSFLVAQPDVDPARVGVVGLSMGGEEAIGAAGRDARIAAVVAEGASARTEQDKAWFEDEYGWRGWLQLRLEWLQYALADIISPAAKPVALATSAAAMAPRPVLLITAGERPDEANAARFIQTAAGDHVSVWTIPGVGHVEGLARSPEMWRQKVLPFLDVALRG